MEITNEMLAEALSEMFYGELIVPDVYGHDPVARVFKTAEDQHWWYEVEPEGVAAWHHISGAEYRRLLTIEPDFGNGYHEYENCD